MTIEFLLALDDGTWTTAIEEVPDAVAKNCLPEQFDGLVRYWAERNLLTKSAYSNVVYIGIYNIPTDDSDE